MLGSLVIVFPTLHQGGDLVLRHKNREWTFNANSLMALRPHPSLAYVAFYSDIDHEVLKVTGGHRVTLTYNLYSTPSITTPLTITPDPNASDSFHTTFRNLLKSPEFLPDGGILGFGLVHLYPVTFKTTLEELVQYLKGEDAHVYRACREFQLKPTLRMIYDDDRSELTDGVMMDTIVEEQPYYDCSYDGSVTYVSNLIDELGGVPVNKTNTTFAERSGEDEITWISPFSERNQLKDATVTLGNEVSVDYIYCSPCLIAHVAPAIDRT